MPFPNYQTVNLTGKMAFITLKGKNVKRENLKPGFCEIYNELTANF